VSAQVQEAVGKCVDAATATIELMHEMFCNHIFFRTWWYNTTYVLYAASIVLCYGTRLASKNEEERYLVLGSKAVKILRGNGGEHCGKELGADGEANHFFCREIHRGIALAK
jgi:hypothetical protein